MAISETPLRAARKAQGLRLVDVAQKAGISTGYLSMIERGLEAPSDVCERLAGALSQPAANMFPEGS